MSYLERLRMIDKNQERAGGGGAKSAKTPLLGTFDTFDTSPAGPFSFFALSADPSPIPVPALLPNDREAIAEAIEERAAIREHDGGEPRPLAEQQARAAMRVYQVLVAMDDGQPPRWTTLLAPGCDLREATAAAVGRFGPDRVLTIRPRPFTHPRQSLAV